MKFRSPPKSLKNNSKFYQLNLQETKTINTKQMYNFLNKKNNEGISISICDYEGNFCNLIKKF